jgi:hypothetical protein
MENSEKDTEAPQARNVHLCLDLPLEWKEIEEEENVISSKVYMD